MKVELTSYRHITKLPSSDGGVVDAIVTEMTSELAKYWHYQYQPIIDEMDRADKGWNWTVYHSWYQRLAKLLNQSPYAYCLGAKGKSGEFVPLGMLLLAGRYPALNQHKLHSAFSWFLATVPEKLIMERMTHKPVGLGKALIDMALTHSYMVGHDGRMGLHADEKGGDKLMDFYRDRIGLVNISKSERLPRGRKLINDGRYFFSNESVAQKIWSSLNGIR